MQSKALILCILLPSSLFAQWVVKTKKIQKGSKDRHVELIVNLPVLTGGNRMQVRKSINAALRQLSEIDILISQAEEAINSHSEYLNRVKPPEDEDDSGLDYPFAYDIDFEVGINDKHFFGIAYTICSQTGGGATGHTAVSPINFYVSTGKQLKLEDIFVPNFEIELRKMFHSELSSIAWLDSDWEKSLETVKYGYMLGKHAITFYFPKYSLAGGAAGVIFINITYKKFRNLVAESNPIAYLLSR